MTFAQRLISTGSIDTIMMRSRHPVYHAARSLVQENVSSVENDLEILFEQGDHRRKLSLSGHDATAMVEVDMRYHLYRCEDWKLA